LIVPATAASAPAPAERTTSGSGVSGDPHSPTLSAASLANGAKGSGNALPVGSYLGEFELTQVIGEGGFGIVYLAVDHSLQRRVALKEYMPSSLAERTSGMQVSSLSEEDEETFRKGLESFINEARLLAQFDHPSLVKVHRFWEANGTAYTVMPFYEGPTLKDTLRDMPGPPDEAWLLGLLEPLTEALAVIHGQQCYHRDIAPDNILLLAGSGRPLLLDFGAARRVIGDANQALTVILKPGYAPIEQYAEVPSMKQGPWTDVYALAAVLYFAITGKKPPAAVGRLLNDQYQPLVQVAAGRYSPEFLSVIDQALAVKPTERTQNIDAFRAALGFGVLARDAAGSLTSTGGAPSTYDPTLRGTALGKSSAGVSGGKAAAKPAAAAPAKRSPAMAVGLGVAGLALAGGGAWWAMSGKPAPAPGPVMSTSSAASAPVAVVTAAPPASSVAVAPAPPPVAAQPFSVGGEFRRIAARQTPGFTVEARQTKTSLRIDHDALSVNSARDGFFYVLSYGSDGELVQLFPNDVVPTNVILAGRSITLPQTAKDPKTGRVEQKLGATEPPGKSQLLVLVSKYPRDFNALGTKRVDHWRSYPSGQSAEALAAAQAPGAPSIYG
jgi:serine/threonine protein kinase